MNKFNTTGVVLKSVNYKDADKLFTILTRDHGKLSAMAKGVRKISSRRAGNLDTLNLVTLKISESRAGFKLIDEVKTLNSFRDTKKSYELSCLGYYMVELVHRSFEEGHEAGEIFNVLVSCLKALPNSRVSPNLIVNHFELELLRILGYEFQVERYAFNKKSSDLLNRLRKGQFPKDANPKVEEDVDKLIKGFLTMHLDSKIKSLELKAS